jgi:hypothetical protein
MEGSNSQQPAKKELQGWDQGTGAPRKQPRKFCVEHRGQGTEKILCGAPRPRRNPQDGGKQPTTTNKKWSKGRKNGLVRTGWTTSNKQQIKQWLWWNRRNHKKKQTAKAQSGAQNNNQRDHNGGDLPCWGRQPSKSIIINIFEDADAVKNGKVSFAESVVSNKKWKDSQCCGTWEAIGRSIDYQVT